MKKGAVIIPARYKSSRFPGKPLIDIHGKSMIQRVYERCVQSVGINRVYVATDDIRIEENVRGFGGRSVLTSSDCLTGTDRIAEANAKLGYDFIVNVQGDEPLINPLDILKVFSHMEHDCSNIVNCYSVLSKEEKLMASVPKVVVSNTGKLLYISRGGIPFNKSGNPKPLYKQVCIYGFSKSHLEIFSKSSLKTQIEEFEDIEVLRFLEMDYKVQMIQVEAGSVAVDTPNDLERVKRVISNL